MVILLRVKVPVLSEQIIWVPPKVSTAGKVRTRALRSAIVWVPMDRIMVEMAGKPSGMAATAKEIDTKSMSGI